MRSLEKTIGTSNEKKQLQVAKRKLVDLSEYYHILNRDETKILYENLSEVFLQILEMQIHNKKLRKKLGVKKKQKTQRQQ